MSDQDKATLNNLLPDGFKPGTDAPEGFRQIELTISRDERFAAFSQVAAMAEMVNSTQGSAETIKNLMLGVEAQAMVMLRFTTTGQVLNILDHIRARVVSFGEFRDSKHTAEAAAEEAAGATKH